ncbi:MAG: hypothetical protein ACE37K_23590 [Planctomycetota bacterium]
MQPIRPLLRAALAPLSLVTIAVGQCDVLPASDGPFAGADGEVRSFVEWDPDGPGPLGVHVVVCGAFRNLANVGGGLALLDPATETFSSIGRCDGIVRDAAVTPNGDLIVGGDFTEIGGIAANDVARFDGTTWSALGNGITDPQGRVHAVAVRPNGDVLVGGEFRETLAGGVVGTSVLRFANNQWSSIGNLVTSLEEYVNDLVVLPNGDVVATGFFALAAGQPVGSIARWDGSGWQPYGSGMAANNILPIGIGEQLLLASNGDLIVVGNFTSIDGVPAAGFARFDGSTWTAAPNLPFGSKRCVIEAASGELLVGGDLRPSGLLYTPAVRSSGGNWLPIGLANAPSYASSLYELPSGALLRGTSEAVAGAPLRGIARWNGLQWRALGPGTDGAVFAAAALGDGDLLVAGDFRSLASVVSPHAARYRDGSWIPAAVNLGTTITGAVGHALDSGAHAIALQAATGATFVFYRDTLTPAYQLIAVVAGKVLAFGEDAAGRLLVGGDYQFTDLYGQTFTGLAAWDPDTLTWLDYDPQFTGSVTAITRLEDGTIVFGGELSQTGGPVGHLATYVAQQWFAVGGDVDAPPRDLAVTTTGNLVVLGDITQAGTTPMSGIATFDGVGWSQPGSGFPVNDPTQRPTCLAAMPNGDLLVGGSFSAAGGVPAANIARWDGTSWHAIGSGADAMVHDLAVRSDGTVLCVGAFSRFDGVETMFVARVEPTCPAIPFEYANGFCTSASLTATLKVRSGAWLGRQARTLATAIPIGHTAVAVYGFTPIGVPLGSLFANAAPFCSLLVDPILVTVPPQLGQVADARLTIPNQPALVGQIVHHHFLTVDLSQPGVLGQVSATDAVAFTIGSHW